MIALSDRSFNPGVRDYFIKLNAQVRFSPPLEILNFILLCLSRAPCPFLNRSFSSPVFLPTQPPLFIVTLQFFPYIYFAMYPIEFTFFLPGLFLFFVLSDFP